MLVSVVVDPSAFNEENFDESYKIQAEILLEGILKNGMLIVDSEEVLREELRKKILSLPSTIGQQLQSLLTEILKNETKYIVACCVESDDNSTDELLDLAINLKLDDDVDVDALIVSNQSLENLISGQMDGEGIVPLSEYRNSDFENRRKRYDNGFDSIDQLPKSEVDEIIVRATRFSKSLRFYDRHIGQRTNTCHFYAGIEYILSLWHEHGFFVSNQDFGKVEIYTCSVNCILEEDTDIRKLKKKKKNKEQHKNIVQEIKTPYRSK